jgi:hypothetical protein
LLDLHHALAYGRAGLWGDDGRAPRSVLLVREGIGQLEAFGAGEPEPAVSWLAGQTRGPVCLLAPEDWWDVVDAQVGAEGVELADVLTFSVAAARFRPVAQAQGAAVRRLGPEDLALLETSVFPAWGLFGWGSFAELIAQGAAVGVPFGETYAALAWIYSQAGRYAAVGVATAPEYRRLGLARASASALIAEILHARRQVPVWSTSDGNLASKATARSLGFSLARIETLLRWSGTARA